MITIKWVPFVNHYNICCCSCTLRTGTLLIAWLGLMLQIIQVMDSASRLYYYKQDLEDIELNNIEKELESEIERQNFDTKVQELDEGVNYEGSGNSGNPDEFEIVDKDSVQEENDDVVNLNSGYSSYAATREAIVTRLFIGLLHVGVHISLLYGVLTGKPQFMLPYILVQLVAVILLELFVIFLFIFIFSYNALDAFLFLILGTLVAIIIAYLWAAVYTYYRQLVELSLPQQETQLQGLTYVKSEEEEAIMNPEEIQRAYEQIEYNIKQNQPHAV